ncbi:MAG: TetR/AcrR family transcriptional regulator [Colwellia sp.]|nr:TetR/AcrR family transcriptional regulator [Colwellia sp.]
MPTKEVVERISKHLKSDDGRMMRTKDSHNKIVSAFLSLLRQGNINPSADDVAKEAKVGLRTVFRRFKEMELLYREVATEVQNAFGPEASKPWLSTIWQEQLEEMLARKADIYERMMPYSIAAQYLRHNSSYLKEFNNRWLSIEHEIIMSILPFSPEDEPEFFNALEGTLSNDSWIQYRKNHQLSPEQSHNTMKVIMDALIQAYLAKNSNTK